MRKALIVGIDHYTHIKPLSGCVNDAHAVKAILERHADGTVNFVTPRILTGTGRLTLLKEESLKTPCGIYSREMQILPSYTSPGTATSKIQVDSSAPATARLVMTAFLLPS